MVILLWFMLLAPGLISAAPRCTLSSATQQIAAEGVTEPAGAITIACTGAAPARLIEGAIGVSFERKVTNRRSGETLDGPVVEIETGASLWSPLEARVVLADTSSVGFEGLRWTADASGGFTLRVRGVRIEGTAETIQAAVRFYLSERIDVASPLVTVARGATALMASAQATLATRGPSPPADADFQTMARLGSPFTATRLSEGFAGAFQGTRFLIRFAGVPDGVGMLAPDVVVGSTGLVATRSGGFGGGHSPGLLSPIGGRRLVLVRVADAEINGQGGRLAVNPAAVSEALGQLRAASFGRGTPYVVYEVVDSDPARMESAEIPAWVAVPPRFDTPFGESVVRATAVLAPISENDGAHPTAPVPRYKPVNPASDCSLLGDCSAAWFPKMRLVEPAPLTFTAAAGSGVQIGSAGIRNDGGGLLEWRVSVRSKQNASWLSVDPGRGVQNGGVRYDINPAGLAAGDYQAELAFEHIAPPNGRADERVYPVSLKVTPASVTPPVVPPPPLPTPVIRDVTTGPARLGGPFAPSSVIMVAGSDLSADTSATVAGLKAVIIAAAPGEIAVVIPDLTPLGRVPLVVTSYDNPSAPWFLEIVPAAPTALFALNADGERNGESAPALRGEPVDVYLTGVPLGAALTVRVHDRVLSARSEDGGAPGVRLARVQIPPDLPAMQTATVITVGGVSSHPLEIWIR